MMIKTLHRFFYAWLFLTRLPAPPLPKATKEDWGRIAPYFTFIGFILGFILFFFANIFYKFHLPVLFSALLVLFLWTLITGGLHLDGLMDTFDGINCQDPERKVAAMKDSRIGAFGAMAGIFVILFKLVTLCTIILNKTFFILIFIPALSRLVVVYSFTFLSRNRNSGESSSLLLNGIKKPQDFILNLLVFLAISLALFLSLPLTTYHLPLVTMASFVISLFFAHWLDKHFKGHTGDTFGASIELSEVTFLSLAVAFKEFLL